MEGNEKIITFALKKTITMSKSSYLLLEAICISLLFACSPDSKLQRELQSIKALGDTDPTAAMEQLDSLSDIMSGCSKRTAMLRDLLEIRLKDKAYLQPDSDSNILEIVEYFDRHGNVRERQEAYYYAGSNYRDWNDEPRSLEYFLKSVDIGQDSWTECDSLLLRNAYSNISTLFHHVHDFDTSLDYRKKEKEFSIALGRQTIQTDIRMGIAYANCDSMAQAISAFNNVMDQIRSNSNGTIDVRSAATALYYYALYDQVERAEQCYELIKGEEELINCPNGPLALSEYHQMNGEVDSAKYYLEYILQNDTSIRKRYDAAKLLFVVANWEKDYALASRYADRFIMLCDTLNVNERMEQVRMASNQYQYYRDKEEDERIKERSRLYARSLVGVSVLAVLLLLVTAFGFERNKNKHLRQILSMTNELKEINAQKQSIAEEAIRQKKKLDIAKETLTTSVNELVKTQELLQEVNSKLRKSELELKQKDELLSQKTEQNQAILQLLHRNSVESDAELVIQNFIKASEGKKQLTIKDWNQLYHAVDKLYPDFKDRLVKNIKSISESQMQFCYLLQIGLSNGQIENLVNLSRATIWRWSKTYAPLIISGEKQ